MKKIIDRYLFIISTNLKLPKIQVLSQNQSSYHFIISKKEQQAKFALLTLVKEELRNEEYKVEINMSLPHCLRSDVNHYFLTEIYLNKKILMKSSKIRKHNSVLARVALLLIKKFNHP
jgi:hypothetical protein